MPPFQVLTSNDAEEIYTRSERKIRGPTWRRSARVIRDRAISVIVEVSLKDGW